MIPDQHGFGCRQWTVKTVVVMKSSIHHSHPPFSTLGCERLYTTVQEMYQEALLEKTSALLNHLTVFGMMTVMSVSMFALNRFPQFLLIIMLDFKHLRLTVSLA